MPNTQYQILPQDDAGLPRRLGRIRRDREPRQEPLAVTRAIEVARVVATVAARAKHARITIDIEPPAQ